MVSQRYANYSLYIGLHIFILFTFLTIFFFTYASKLKKKRVNDTLDCIVHKQVSKFMSQVDILDKKLKLNSYRTINWDFVNNLAKKLEKKSQRKLSEFDNNNNILKWISILIVGILFTILIGMYIYFKLIKKYDIHIGRIFTENLIFFSLIGIVEIIFFVKYNPYTLE